MAVILGVIGIPKDKKAEGRGKVLIECKPRKRSDSVKPYDKFEDLVYLLTFDSNTDMEKYIDSRTDLYIDQKTGKITTRRIVNTDPFSFRPGSISVYEREKSYDDFRNILDIVRANVDLH